ncbi:MAG: hypothetical protein M1501_00980 [Candidatus Omnitrophica bacterium]|nr:hypothetical protein [Candidatus Omnitrophota bacterium]
MAKAKLGALTSKWIDGKTERRNNGKTEKQSSIKTEKQKDGIMERRKVDGEKVKQTLYISRGTVKLLWQNRVDTGESISAAIERLVLENMGKETRG